MKQGEYKKSITERHKALELRKKSVGKKSKQYFTVFWWTAMTFYNQGDYYEVIQSCQDGLNNT